MRLFFPRFDFCACVLSKHEVVRKLSSLLAQEIEHTAGERGTNVLGLVSNNTNALHFAADSIHIFLVGSV